MQHLVKAGALIKKGRTGKGVHYILSSTYKGDKIVIEQSSDANLAIESGGKVVIRK